MRASLVIGLLLLSVVAVADAAAPLLVRYHPASGATLVGVADPLDPQARRFEADACSTASPGALTCDGLAGPHPAITPPDVWLQALFYPRELASLEGGAFDMTMEWASGETTGVRCTVAPTTQDPAALFSVACVDIGTRPSYEWLDSEWTFHGRQDASLLGAIQHTVVFDGAI